MHETFAHWFSDHIWWILLWMWILGILGELGTWNRKRVAARRQHEINMARTKRGLPVAPAAPADDDGWDPDAPGLHIKAPGFRLQVTGTTGPSVSGTLDRNLKPVQHTWPDPDWDETEREIPAAVIPSPPSARRTGPGPCPHDKIIPVIGTDGELLRWICANWPRCDARFHKSIAVYEPNDND